MASAAIGGMIVDKYIEYVAKEDVIELFRSYGHTGEDIPFHVLDDSIFEMKAADVAPIRHGHWIRVSLIGVFECSECGNQITAADGEFAKKVCKWCLHCGAKMDEEVSE